MAEARALVDLPIQPVSHAFEEPTARLIAEGLRRGREIDCFDFVPSEYHALHAVLAALPCGRYCEWGSGMGIGVAVAETLGFEAMGIEIHPELADASRRLLADFGLRATIVTGSYYELAHDADVYFVYCWPGQMRRVQEHFTRHAPDDATLVICDGAARPLCKAKAGAGQVAATSSA